MPKVVAVDNFARESVADYLVAENLSQEDAERLCAEKRAECAGQHSPVWYVVQPDEYVLWRGMEELV